MKWVALGIVGAWSLACVAALPVASASLCPDDDKQPTPKPSIACPGDDKQPPSKPSIACPGDDKQPTPKPSVA